MAVGAITPKHRVKIADAYFYSGPQSRHMVSYIKNTVDLKCFQTNDDDTKKANAKHPLILFLLPRSVDNTERSFSPSLSLSNTTQKDFAFTCWFAHTQVFTKPTTIN